MCFLWSGFQTTPHHHPRSASQARCEDTSYSHVTFSPLGARKLPYPLHQVFINVALATNNAVEASRRGTLSGLSMTTGSLAKAAGPTFFSSIFAWSIDGRRRPFPLDYHLAFYLLALGYARFQTLFPSVICCIVVIVV